MVPPSLSDRSTAALGALAEGTRRPHVQVDVHGALVSLLLAFAIVRACGRTTVPTWKSLLATACLGPALRRGVSTALALHTSDEALDRAWGALGLGIDAERLGTLYENLCTVRVDENMELAPSLARRRAGSHYTPPAIAHRVSSLALGPLGDRAKTPEDVLALRVCDPAAGGGAFLLSAARALGELLRSAHDRAGLTVPNDAAKLVAERCLRGVDLDPVAADVTRAALFIEHGALLPEAAIAVGDALVDESLDWRVAFADVFDERGGFDAFVGNPPWISFVGRATQPIAPELKRTLMSRYSSFSGYRNLQGVFLERCASLLAPGGRLGLLVPSSMSEQSGYAPTRNAHDRYCVCDDALPDLGDSFEGVFQPCMALLSTRRDALAIGSDARWPMERPDLDDLAASILHKLEGPALAPGLFGERGVQSFGDDKAHMRDAPDETHTVALRTGSDMHAFRRGPPRAWADPSWFRGRLRPAKSFEQVRVLIRQTARFPIACLSDGLGFRNSILAGFAQADLPAEALVAWLNSNPIRYCHYARHRDARQGMPQVKIGHLRVLPAPPPAIVGELASLGAELSKGNDGTKPEDQHRLDDLVARAFDLNEAEVDRIRDWASKTR